VISRLHSTTILVSDQEAALRFYVDVLGWEKREDNQMSPTMRFLTVAPPGAQTAIVLGQPEVYGRPAPLAISSGDAGTGISLITPDITATYAELTAKGVRFKQPPETMPWGAKATWFSDPFGNEFFLVEE
jgi:catechol 2,3-dioxygenase-like lactoylglutathione lyase family enzyme